ncbi:SCO1 homolog 2, mitochondrial-like protein [Drosera capensis]
MQETIQDCLGACQWHATAIQTPENIFSPSHSLEPKPQKTRTHSMLRAVKFCIRTRRIISNNLELLQGHGLCRSCQSRCYAWHKKDKRTGYCLPTYTSSSSSTSSTSAAFSYCIPAAAVLGLVGVGAYLHYNDERRAVPKGQHGNGEGLLVKGPIIGGPFALVDTNNSIITEQVLLGNWVLLYFGYTSSPDVGPAEVQKMADVVATLESKQNVKVLPIFVTLDPLRDSPSQLRAYLREFDPRIMGLTGSAAAIRQMAQAYRVFFKKVEEDGNDYLVESSHNMYLMNPNMEIVRCFGVEYNSKDLSEAIVKLVKEAS